MKQNKYDDSVFFEKYTQMTRSVLGLEGAGEWKTFKKLLPDFNSKRVLDLGCGFGWHCQYALEHGAESVIGIDISEKMLAAAKERTAKSIQYLCNSIEDAEFSPDQFDIVISSLVFHYIQSFEDIVKKVHSWLTDGGKFIFSVEHPVYTAYGTQDWIYDETGKILYFPVDNYFYEGARETNFLGEKVIKYHKTITTYLNSLIHGGFEITGIVEPQPDEHMLSTVDGMKDELRRPMMLIVAAVKI